MSGQQHLPLIDDYLLHLQTDNYSEETVYNYERDLKIFESFLSELDIPFSKVTKRVIEQYKAYLASRDRKTSENQQSKIKLNGNSLNRLLSSLRSYMKYLVEMDYTLPVPQMPYV